MTDNPQNILQTRHKYDYTPELEHGIVAHYREGKSIITISRLPEMPSASVMYAWMISHPEFKAKLKAAREVRAMIMEDEILDMAASVENIGKDDVPAARLKLDILKWGASVSDPSTYGTKATISGDKSSPITFIVQSGVPAPLSEVVQLTADGLVKDVASEVSDAE